MNHMQIQHYVISALVFAACTASVTLADTLEVPDEYPTIQLAIDAAVDGETGPHANPVFARNVTGSFEAPTAAAETAGDPRTHAGASGATCTHPLFVGLKYNAGARAEAILQTSNVDVAPRIHNSRSQS